MKNKKHVLSGTSCVALMFIAAAMATLSCATGAAVQGDLAQPQDSVKNYAYLSVANKNIQIFAIDGIVTSIPLDEKSFLLVPAGEHILSVQYYHENDSNIIWAEPQHYAVDFNTGEYYTVRRTSSDGKTVFSINTVPAETAAKHQKKIDAFAMPKGSQWGYHTINTEAPTKFDGQWKFAGNSAGSSAGAVEVDFEFKGNYFVLKNNAGLALLNPTLGAALFAGAFEFTDDKLTLNVYAQYSFVRKLTKTLLVLQKWTDIGFYGQYDAIGAKKHQTYEFTYELEGDTLVLKGKGIIYGNVSVTLHRVRVEQQ
jgi:hypothetical protein